MGNLTKTIGFNYYDNDLRASFKGETYGRVGPYIYRQFNDNHKHSNFRMEHALKTNRHMGRRDETPNVKI